jgi:hypothetical protein
VTYALTGNYRGEVNGNAQVEWIRVGSRYQVNLDFVVGPEFAPIIARRMRSEGDLTAEAWRRTDTTRTPGDVPGTPSGPRDVRARRRRAGQRRPRERLRGVQDTASQFVQLTYLFTTRPELLRVGGTVEVPLALPRNVDRWIYDVIEEVEIQTPFGPLRDLSPEAAALPPDDPRSDAEIWFAPQLRYLPVRIRIEQDPQTFVDLVIARKPELASR